MGQPIVALQSHHIQTPLPLASSHYIPLSVIAWVGMERDVSVNGPVSSPRAGTLAFQNVLVAAGWQSYLQC